MRQDSLQSFSSTDTEERADDDSFAEKVIAKHNI
jgi:hypothetical protein